MIIQDQPILSVRDLKTYFYIDGGVVKAVDGVSFDIYKGRTLGIVGESGSGKSITSLTVMRLLPIPPAKIEGGEVLFKGQDLLKLGKEEIRAIRGNDIAMIFQEPLTSLNPLIPVGRQVSEPMLLHKHTDITAAKMKAIDLMNDVRIPNAEARYRDYPHQLSGGMRQRVMIAMALSCEPEILICDEPTTALDVTIQAQILELINELKDKFGSAIIMITHDMGVIAEMADDVIVMYAGKIMERAPVHNLFQKPLHPYTQALLESIPKLNKTEKLKSIKGMLPKPTDMPEGCLFSPRCDYAEGICHKEMPQEIYLEDRAVRCWRYHDQGVRP